MRLSIIISIRMMMVMNMMVIMSMNMMNMEKYVRERDNNNGTCRKVLRRWQRHESLLAIAVDVVRSQHSQVHVSRDLLTPLLHQHIRHHHQSARAWLCVGQPDGHDVVIVVVLCSA